MDARALFICIASPEQTLSKYIKQKYPLSSKPLKSEPISCKRTEVVCWGKGGEGRKLGRISY
jgi:hypothetical protein